MIDKIDIPTDAIIGDIALEEDLSADWYVTDDYYQWYYSYGYNFKPKSYLEFGLRYGYSMIAVMRGALAAGTYVEYASAVDAEIYSTIGSNLIAKNILNRIFPNLKLEIFKENSVNFDVNNLQLKRYDMIHLDASHEIIGLAIEIEKAWPILKPNGVMIIDDVFLDIDNTFMIHKFLSRWVLDYLENLKKYCCINNFRGHFILVKG